MEDVIFIFPELESLSSTLWLRLDVRLSCLHQSQNHGKKIRFDRTFLSTPNSLKTYSSNSLKPALLKKLGEQTAADNGSYSALCPLWLWLRRRWSLAKLPQQWDHAAGCFDDFAHATFVARTQTFQTEAMGSKSVGEALPHTGSRSICQSHIGPTSDVALDAYAQWRLSVCIQRSQTLGALLRLHPAIVATQFCNVKINIAWLFPDDGDVDGAGAFLRSLLWNKEAMGQSTLNEASKFTALLRKQAQQTDLRKVPACCARAWLLQIWKDVTSARPNQDLLVGCCVRDLYSAAFQMMEDLWWAFGRAFVIGHPKKTIGRGISMVFSRPRTICQYVLLRSMPGAFSQLPDAKMLCRSALVFLAALGTTNSRIATQVTSWLVCRSWSYLCPKRPKMCGCLYASWCWSLTY